MTSRLLRRLTCLALTLWPLGAASDLRGQAVAPLPAGTRAVWDLSKAHRLATATRESVCLNGLWRWQPAQAGSDRVPEGGWGHFKVPGCWPGITDYMQKDCQTVHAHPAWKDRPLRDLSAAWHQREIAIPASWAGRRIAIRADYLNSFAAVYIDGKAAGEMRFPGGWLDLTAACRPGAAHVLSLLVVAMPLQGVRLSYTDSNAARQAKGFVARRGLCGDVVLESFPAGPRIADVGVQTSVRRGQITIEADLEGLAAQASYALGVKILRQGRTVKTLSSKPFRAADLREGRLTLSEDWRAEQLWDVSAPENQYDLEATLLDAGGQALDAAGAVRFGFREFWIDGRDFILNGTRIVLSAVPLDNAQVGAAWSTYAAARESLRRLAGFGINFVYTHNYGCQPGSHLGFEEILRAADDAGMLVALSQPHFADYDWQAPDAQTANGYAHHARFYVRQARHHPSVVMYSMSHNATGYNEDMSPDLMDGVQDRRDTWAQNNLRRAVRAEQIVRRLDPSRIVYHHSSGNLGSMHTSNFYPNFVPVQELSDWFQTWATRSVKPFFACEYGAPFTWDWAMYRGWHKGKREFGSAVVPWEFCLAEWNAQFLGEAAYALSPQEKRNLRWEAQQFRAGRLWHRWDYPHQLGSSDFDERYPVLERYLQANWRAFRTWGVSAISPWEHHVFWKLRPGMDRNRLTPLPTDYDALQRPGFSPDYLRERYERMDLAYEPADWTATPAARAMLRNNMPLLAWLAGKADAFTSQDHNFLPGQTVDKQIVVINNSRSAVTCEWAWSMNLPAPARGQGTVRVEAGQQARVPIRAALPPDLPPGPYEISMTARMGGGSPVQDDRFAVHVLAPPPPAPPAGPRVALFDPQGQTGRLLASLGVACRNVQAGADLSDVDVLVMGKSALTAEGPAPDIRRVAGGLKVLVFEQTSQALEQRLGLRVQEYGLRDAFVRVAGHPALAGVAGEHLRDWRGESTLLPPRLGCEPSRRYNMAPAVRWCGLEVPRLWRCGNRGTVASVLIEKPTRGDFLPLIDGGFSLQYSPLLEYREGRGMVLFCQLDVTGRTEDDPAAERLVRNLLAYVSTWKPGPLRQAVYAGDPRGRAHLEACGVEAGRFTGAPLRGDQVLVLAPGGPAELAPHRSAVAAWLKAGGHVLALELEGEQAGPLLPSPVRTARQEYIAASFEPARADSLLAGIAPADVHNRDVRELPLLAEGARSVGGGVLAEMEAARVVFCALAPFRLGPASSPQPPDFGEQLHLRRTHRRLSFLLSRLLGNLGVQARTPLLERFAQGLPAQATGKGRWLTGLYLDQPIEWDDPYRFFRW